MAIEGGRRIVADIPRGSTVRIREWQRMNQVQHDPLRGRFCPHSALRSPTLPNTPINAGHPQAEH
jgi:hypothetical protein